MPRAIWSGSIGFGLVNVPVKLYSATEQKDIAFHQFQKGTGQRVRYKRVAEESGEEVEYRDIVKGYEIRKGHFIVLTPEELESVEPGQSRTIEIEDFVDLADVDPIYFEKSYYLAPADSTAEKPYALLLAAMEERGRVAIGRMVMREKQYLAAIRPADGVLVLNTMLFADEVRDPRRELGELPSVEVSDRERAMAAQLIDSLTTEWEPARYRDTYRDRVQELIDRKAEGEEIVIEEPERPAAAVVDLMAALEASVRAAREGRRGAGEDPTAPDYALLSKDELQQEAARRHIPGRSKMSKDELVDALRRSERAGASTSKAS